MKVEHIAIYVNDLARAKEFFIKYFNASANGDYHNKNTNFRSCFLSFDGGARIELMNRPDMRDLKKDTKRTGYAHIAFSVGSREKVAELTREIKCGGYEVLSEPRTTGDGYYESCIVGIEDNLIEITV
ncbi:MAG: VOC family protein [Ruminococcus sp.]|nr:VOC family protein [Ruminococcus sp.]